jgi:hypothetical protein
MRKTSLDIGGTMRKEPGGDPNILRKPLRRNHNAGGKSSRMKGFFVQPGPPLWQAPSGEHPGRRFVSSLASQADPPANAGKG